MKAIISLGLLCSLPLFAAAQNPTTAAYNTQLKKMENKAEQKELMKTTQAAALKSQGPEEVMVVQPLARAQDLEEAYKFLRTYRSAAPIVFHLKNKKTLTNVTGLNVMKGGTIIIFTTNTTKGVKYEVVKTEDIDSIGS